jgi:hypothetical protein
LLLHSPATVVREVRERFSVGVVAFVGSPRERKSPDGAFAVWVSLKSRMAVLLLPLTKIFTSTVKSI